MLFGFEKWKKNFQKKYRRSHENYKMVAWVRQNLVAYEKHSGKKQLPNEESYQHKKGWVQVGRVNKAWSMQSDY